MMVTRTGNPPAPDYQVKRRQPIHLLRMLYFRPVLPRKEECVIFILESRVHIPFCFFPFTTPLSHFSVDSIAKRLMILIK
jgi:hypothetical protein